MRLPQWVPPVAWMVVILALSTDSGSSENTGRFLFPALRFVLPTASPLLMETIHGFIRKLAHVTEYAALAGLWYRALAGWPSPLPAGIALGLSVAWAGVDEAFQRLTPSRTPSLVDVGIDAMGALLASLGATAWPRVVDVVTSTLLWTAMIVGFAALAITGLGGIVSGALWVTTAAAVLAVAARARTSSG
jgi:VanZ family protein